MVRHCESSMEPSFRKRTPLGKLAVSSDGHRVAVQLLFSSTSERKATLCYSIPEWMNLNSETKIWGNNGINFHGSFVKQNCSSCRQGLAALLIPKFYFWKTDSKDRGVSKSAYRCHSWRLPSAQHHIWGTSWDRNSSLSCCLWVLMQLRPQASHTLPLTHTPASKFLI